MTVKIFIISCYFIKATKNVYLKVYILYYPTRYLTISAQSENTTGIMLKTYKNISLMN
jgi:hypothetical protein